MSDKSASLENVPAGIVVWGIASFAAAVGSAVVAVVGSPATGILVFAAAVMLLAIWLLWTSVRTLSGDVDLPPELEALEAPARGVDALASRKKMLLRSLKDLENEHAIGKIEDDDYRELTATARAELKTVLQRIDESLAPHRARAEDLARRHLEKAGLANEAAPSTKEAPSTQVSPVAAPETSPSRVVCPSCKESNEPDAKFCKGCAAKLTPSRASTEGPDGA